MTFNVNTKKTLKRESLHVIKGSINVIVVELLEVVGWLAMPLYLSYIVQTISSSDL